MKTFSLKVLGRPEPKGSMKAMPDRSGRRYSIMMNSSKKTTPWELTVRLNAKQIWHEQPLTCGCEAIIWFFFKRPKSVKRSRHTVRPDIDKLARTILDALTGVVFKDDSLIYQLTTNKQYANYDGAIIEIVPNRT